MKYLSQDRWDWNQWPSTTKTLCHYALCF